MYEVLTYCSESETSFLEKIDVPYEEACRYVCGLLVAARNIDPENFDYMSASPDNGGPCVFSGTAVFKEYHMMIKLFSEALVPISEVPDSFSEDAEELFKSHRIERSFV